MTDDQKKKPLVPRDKRGKFVEGFSGNPKGKPKSEGIPTVAAAREKLPVVIRKMIDLAAKDGKWLEALKKSDPGKYATLLISLNKYNEESITGKAAQDTVKYIGVADNFDEPNSREQRLEAEIKELKADNRRLTRNTQERTRHTAKQTTKETDKADAVGKLIQRLFTDRSEAKCYLMFRKQHLPEFERWEHEHQQAKKSYDRIMNLEPGDKGYNECWQ